MKLLEAAERPLYLLSEQRRIVFCNPALAEWLGFETSQLTGRTCDYHTRPTGDPLDRCVAGLCPPPEALAGNEMQGIVGCHTAGGEFVQRRAEFLPLGTDPSHCPGVIVLLSASDAIDADPNELEQTDPSAPQLHHCLARLQAHQSERYHLGRLAGDSPAIRRVRNQVELASQSSSPVLIVGPAGSGREHVARTIHYAGDVSSHAPLVPLSCSLLDAELLRTTVTAFVRQCAELETEQSAALMLLEVDQLAADAQSELVGFLTISELELQPISTARRNLLEMSQEGGFREDLAHALSTLIVNLPPLTERRSDIPLAAQAFVEDINAEGKQQRGGFTPEALDLLAAYSWPGNLDELASAVRQAHLRADGPLIGAADLPREIHLAAEHPAGGQRGEESIVLTELLEQIETQLIQRALKRSKGNKTKAARLLGMNRARLLRRLAQLPAESGD